MGISLDQEKDALLKTTQAGGVTWPQYFDGKGWQNDISSSFGIMAIPRMWLVNQKGMLVDYNVRDPRAAVEKLLGAKASP